MNGITPEMAEALSGDDLDGVAGLRMIDLIDISTAWGKDKWAYYQASHELKLITIISWELKGRTDIVLHYRDPRISKNLWHARYEVNLRKAYTASKDISKNDSFEEDVLSDLGDATPPKKVAKKVKKKPASKKKTTTKKVSAKKVVKKVTKSDGSA